MGIESQRPFGHGVRSGRTNGFRALRTISRIVSSGALSVASTVRSAASSIVERDEDTGNDQVHWAGFDKIEYDKHNIHKVLLLSYRSGFQVWDVEDTSHVRELVSVRDGPVSFLQMQPAIVGSRQSYDRFATSRPLLVVCVDAPHSISNPRREMDITGVRGTTYLHDNVDGCFVRFYSLKSMSYVHVLKFRSTVFSVRCSSRILAISQAAQIHCFDAATLEREYTILTNPIVSSSIGCGSAGYGPLAVGSRWLAYSGSLVITNSSRIKPEHLTLSTTSPNAIVAQYAKESSRQLAAGIATLGGIGYKKLSSYCSERSNSPRQGNSTLAGHSSGFNSVGMVIVRDIVNKYVIAQFRAHKSPISALCFDPSGVLLLTASIHGHNINVFRIMPSHNGSKNRTSSGNSYIHLYRLQRGITNAVIQDISISSDSSWIMISSLRGTSHLFNVSLSGGLATSYCSGSSINDGNGFTGLKVYSPASNMKEHDPSRSNIPVTISPISRIRSGGSSWRSVIGGVGTASGRMSSLSGVVASSFYNCKSYDFSGPFDPRNAKCHLLVFSPLGCIIHYALHASHKVDSMAISSVEAAFHGSAEGYGEQMLVEAVQKWNICQKRNRRDQDTNIDIYGENGCIDGKKIFPEEGIEKKFALCSSLNESQLKIECKTRTHAYISEAELQMHQTRIPLWEKSEFHFESFSIDGVAASREESKGEVEIEKISTHTIEARLRNLVPSVGLPQNPNYQHEWACCGGTGQICGLAEGHDNEDNVMSTESSSGFVNIKECQGMGSPLDSVNKMESLGTEIHHEIVNTNIEGPGMYSQCGGKYDVAG